MATWTDIDRETRVNLPARDRQRVALYDSGWHMLLRDLQAATVWADIAAWIADPGAALPSGADARATAAGLDGRR